jgi:hypothetical protein
VFPYLDWPLASRSSFYQKMSSSLFGYRENAEKVCSSFLLCSSRLCSKRKEKKELERRSRGRGRKREKKIRNRSGRALADFCKDLCMSETCGKETEKWQIEDELLLRV